MDLEGMDRKLRFALRLPSVFVFMSSPVINEPILGINTFLWSKT